MKVFRYPHRTIICCHTRLKYMVLELEPNLAVVLELKSPSTAFFGSACKFIGFQYVESGFWNGHTSHNGLLIYNTTATNTGLSGVGFYYWQQETRGPGCNRSPMATNPSLAPMTNGRLIKTLKIFIPWGTWVWAPALWTPQRLYKNRPPKAFCPPYDPSSARCHCLPSDGHHRLLHLDRGHCRCVCQWCDSEQFNQFQAPRRGV